jgi:undecaprenyl-diphosphatase
MGWFQAIISGIVQGVAEFLPISSSGHLVVLHKLTGSGEPEILFDLFLHLGTLAAIFIVFGKDIIEAVTTKKKTGFLILLGSVVTFLLVILFIKNIEAAFENVRTVGFMFILTGVWLIAGSFIRFGTEKMTALKAGLIGLAQGIAALPGISRSGATISTGLFLGLDGQASAKFSFLLSIPVILGAFLFKVKESGLNFSAINANYFIGFIVSCLVGIVSLKILLKVLYRDKFHWFGVYCILLGITVVLFLKP